MKRRLMDMCILPILTYGAQTWSLTSVQKSRLKVCQRAMERSILGVRLTDRVRNTTLRSKTQIADVAEKAAKLKWNWAGHVCRMPDDAWAKIATKWTPPTGRRRRGRPRKRWRDELDSYNPDWRLSDQVRAIQRCHLLDDATLERLRSDSLRSCVNPTSSQTVTPTATALAPTLVPMYSGPTDEDVGEAVSSVSTQCNSQLRSALEGAILEYRNTPPHNRPRLPRLPTHRKNISLVVAMDMLLADYICTCNDLIDVHSILYCAANTVCRIAGVKFQQDTAVRPKPAVPAWQYRIERRIADARVTIGKLICFRSGNMRPRVMRFVRRAFTGTDISPQDYHARITERIDFLKQKVYAWANRIKRYKKRVARYTQNRMFQSDQKWIYRDWERSDQSVGNMGLPDADSTNTFWRSIWSVPVDHTEGVWMREVERACEPVERMPAINIETEDVANAVRSLANWKSPGPDGLHNFWLKWLRSSHARLASLFQSSVESGSLPSFLTNGITHLLYKSGNATDPKNYRPITCLPTLYKLLTSILRGKLNEHITANNIMAISQNGCRNGARGTKELLLIDTAICQQVRRNRRSLSTCWIDYKKAYDSVPHSWLLRVLELYKVDATLCAFLRSCMGQWTTGLRYPGCGRVLGDGELLRIERGIFQGDSLSPLWFCLALNPLSTLLGISGQGYRLRRDGQVISHLFYMDDLKLFASSEPQMVELLKVTEVFSNSIRMEFGVDKCAVMHVKQGRVVTSEGLQLSDHTTLRPLLATDTYKYLGMSQALGIDEVGMKRSLRERFFGRLRKVLNSLLSGGNKVRAFNGWVIPLLMYSFGILKWTQTELDALDRRVRSLLTSYRMHHPRSSVMRLYIPRKCGGRGFLNAKTLHNREVCSLRDYFLSTDVGLHRDVVAVDKGLTPLSLANENWRRPVVMDVGDRVDVWRSKELHGRYYRALHGSDVDLLASVAWLRFGDLFGETEGFVCAIADEVVKTNNYRKYIMKDGTIDVCRACHQPGESLRHIFSFRLFASCQWRVLAQTQPSSQDHPPAACSEA
ncbi:uncharacterized protein LOC142982823 [Anticarsia gemmatalis]|uniref:uncharacterized protein LOC142982823 n=1 Tax=Anticarsia gemmatalis TaxID=129554 RepID=UPI003F777497